MQARVKSYEQRMDREIEEKEGLLQDIERVSDLKIEPLRFHKDFWEMFASELAAMHQAEIGESYGFSIDNWIGSRKQTNTFCHSWVVFFRDCRLKPQFVAAEKYFSVNELKKAEWLLEHLDEYLTEPQKPSLVHGDLWAGNMITGDDGKGWLIDPAVYYGHSEVDLAMTELFGGFSGRFYDAYRSFGNVEPGYEDRRDLYNLSLFFIMCYTIFPEFEVCSKMWGRNSDRISANE